MSPAAGAVQRFSGSAVQRFSGSAVQRFSGSAVQRFSGSAVQRFSGSAVQRFSNRLAGAVRLSIIFFLPKGSISDIMASLSARLSAIILR
ncbi:hypothetical protein GCM10009414_29460 [Tatumella terrea]